MGTVGYMSPEQVKGGASDERSDIFSFGVVLYEMLSGKRAFKRDTSAEIMTVILREEPAELSDTGWQGPPALQRILARCLEKNVERRFQSASDLAFAIESLSGSSGASATRSVETPKARRMWLPWAAAALAVLALVASVWTVSRRSAAKPQPKSTRLNYQENVTFPCAHSSPERAIKNSISSFALPSEYSESTALRLRGTACAILFLVMRDLALCGRYNQIHR